MKLYELLNEEIYSLNTGHAYNSDRIQVMKDICHILSYYNYVNMSDTDLIKLMKSYN